MRPTAAGPGTTRWCGSVARSPYDSAAESGWRTRAVPYDHVAGDWRLAELQRKYGNHMKVNLSTKLSCDSCQGLVGAGFALGKRQHRAGSHLALSPRLITIGRSQEVDTGPLIRAMMSETWVVCAVMVMKRPGMRKLLVVTMPGFPAGQARVPGIGQGLPGGPGSPAGRLGPPRGTCGWLDKSSIADPDAAPSNDDAGAELL